MKTSIILAALAFILTVLTVGDRQDPQPRSGAQRETPERDFDGEVARALIEHDELPRFLLNGLKWLALAQNNDGSWGAGSHNAQHVRDPRIVQPDPATTAFAAMALMRSGSSLDEGPYHTHTRRALIFLLDLVESRPEAGNTITDITGTQPQVKLGQHIDVAMVAQLFTRALQHAEHDPKLSARITAGLNKCLRKLQRTQGADGSWSGPGWAPVLQSAMANQALEMAQSAGMAVDGDVLEKSRRYQKENVDGERGDVRTEAAAGIPLYALSSSQRATARETREAVRKVEEAKARGAVSPGAEVNEETLMQAGYSGDEAASLSDAYRQNQATTRMLEDESVLSGFGNNGGEEFLSYMMSAESLVLTDINGWSSWHGKMSNRLQAVQNQNGSWSGHHCITSPVFSTAAVILTLTAERDRHFLAAAIDAAPTH